MTVSDFLAFYPQFAGAFPEPVVSAYAESAGLRFDEFGEDAEEARRLYTAHKLTLYAKTMPPEAGSGEASFAALASAGDGTRIAGKKVDDVSVTYASGASASGSSGLADLSETLYGQQLLALLRVHALPRYVP